MNKTLDPAIITGRYGYNPTTGDVFDITTNRICGHKSYKANKAPNGMVMKISGVPFRVHRIAFVLMTGRWPNDQIDHINGNPFDNRWSNLREATCSMNNRNRSSSGKSGLKGVCPSGRKWTASIRVDGNVIHLGAFPTKGLAAVARAKAAIRYHGEFARFS